MDVYIIRHGQSECNRLKLRCGWSKTDLSELGCRQAEAIRPYLQGIHFDRVYCSDLPRTIQTAKRALPGAELILTDKIREINVGRLADRPEKDCEAEYGEAYLEGMRLQDFRSFGGESQEEMAERVRSFTADLEKLRDADKVAVVGHEGTLHQMLEVALGTDILIDHIKVYNASVSVFRYEESKGWRLISWNFTGSLNTSFYEKI